MGPDSKPNPSELREVISLNTLLQLIPEFDTNQATQVYRFVRSCDSAFNLANPSQTDILLIYALNKIIGTSSSDVHARQYASWDDLKTFLIQKFSQTKTLAHLNLEIQSYFQKPNESVTEYYHRVDLCRNKILDKLTAEISDISLAGRKATTEETALSVFVNGVNSNLGTMLRTKGFTSLSEAANFAIQEEKIQNMNRARQILCKNSGTTSYNGVPRRPPPTNQGTSGAHYNTSKQTKICNYCKKPGHVIAECRKRAYNNNLRNQQNERPTGPTTSPARVNNLNSSAAEETGTTPGTASLYYQSAPIDMSRQDTVPELRDAIQNMQLE